MDVSKIIEIAERERLFMQQSAEEEEARKTMWISLACASLVVIVMLGVVLSNNSQTKRKLETNNLLLRTQQHELEQLNQQKNLLLSIVSHDIRGPVGTLRATLELTLQGYLTPEEYQQQLKGLLANTLQTERVLNDILLWAKAHMDRFDVALQPIA